MNFATDQFKKYTPRLFDLKKPIYVWQCDLMLTLKIRHRLADDNKIVFEDLLMYLVLQPP